MQFFCCSPFTWKDVVLGTSVDLGTLDDILTFVSHTNKKFANRVFSRCRGFVEIIPGFCRTQKRWTCCRYKKTNMEKTTYFVLIPVVLILILGLFVLRAYTKAKFVRSKGGKIMKSQKNWSFVKFFRKFLFFEKKIFNVHFFFENSKYFNF